MKLASLVIGAMAALPMFAASVTGDNVFGILKLSGVTTTNTIIAVPWVDCTDASQNVTVSNIVMTTGLTEGDKVVYFDGSTYKGYTLNSSGQWTPITSATVSGVECAPGSDELRPARGKGIFLVRGSNWNGKSFDVYLYGQKGETVSSSTLTSGYTLLSNPNPTSESKAISSLVSSPTAGDKIIVMKNGGDSQDVIIYKGGWKKQKTDTKFGSTLTSWEDASSVKIPAGAGFWYYNAGSSAKTINW